MVDGLPPTPATCLPEGETGSEEEVEKGEKASSSSSLPSVRTSKQCKYCALSWKQGFPGASGARCPWCHLCPGEAKTLKDVVANRLNLAATLPPLALQFESEDARGSGSSFPEVLPLLTKSLPPVPPPTRSAPNFQEAQVPPAPCWDSEPKGLELETFRDEKLDDCLRVKPAVNVSLPSVGSILHGTGTCKPCAWFWKPQGCHNGSECGHCHLCPVGESKNRRQAKMAAWRQGGPPSGAATTLPPLALVPPVPEDGGKEPSWRPPPGLELDLSPTNAVPPLPPVPPPPVAPPPAPAAPLAPLTGPALGSVGSAKHSTGECTLCPDAFTPEGCPKGPLCEKCHLCAAEFRVSETGPKDALACILCGTNRCSCPRIHSGMACTEPDVVAAENPSTDLPSLGSVLHAKGNCSPCAWVWKAQGCHNGRSCGRCHLCPPGEVKLRKKAKAREARHGRKEYFCSSY